MKIYQIEIPITIIPHDCQRADDHTDVVRLSVRADNAADAIRRFSASLEGLVAFTHPWLPGET